MWQIVLDSPSKQSLTVAGVTSVVPRNEGWFVNAVGAVQANTLRKAAHARWCLGQPREKVWRIITHDAAHMLWRATVNWFVNNTTGNCPSAVRNKRRNMAARRADSVACIPPVNRKFNDRWIL